MSLKTRQDFVYAHIPQIRVMLKQVKTIAAFGLISGGDRAQKSRIQGDSGAGNQWLRWDGPYRTVGGAAAPGGPPQTSGGGGGAGYHK